MVRQDSAVNGPLRCSRAHASMSAHSHAGRPPTVHVGAGNVTTLRRMRHASTAERVTLSRCAISTVPTGSQDMAEKCMRSVALSVDSGDVGTYNAYMANSENNPHKTRRQMARAHKLVAVIDGHAAHLPNETRLTFAENLSVAKWDDVALVAGITSPSITTVTMAISLLEARVANDQLSADDAFMAFAVAR